jgi:hypothetical protein
MVVFSSELLAYYDLTFIILVSTGQARGIQALCLKSPKSYLETVSTVRGSGWVAVPKCEIAIDYEYDRFTHPLPRTVLTVSKRDFGLLRQRRGSFVNPLSDSTGRLIESSFPAVP